LGHPKGLPLLMSHQSQFRAKTNFNRTHNKTRVQLLLMTGTKTTSRQKSSQVLCSCFWWLQQSYPMFYGTADNGKQSLGG
jgi:hypothetical protein